MTSLINEPAWDRALRIVLGVVLLYLGWAGVVGGTLGLVVKVLGFVPQVTGLVGWCPAYAVFGISICKVTPKGAPVGQGQPR